MNQSRSLLAALFLLALVGCEERLQHDLSEQDANDIMVLLNEHAVAAKKERAEGGDIPKYVISVPKADYAQAAKLLREYSLPRQEHGGFSDFRKGKGMIPTQTEERAMFLEAVQGEISNALNKVDGVLEARVIVMIPEPADLAQPENKPYPSASIFLRYRPDQEGKPPLEERQIQAFVAHAVDQMKPENVTVIMSRGIPAALDAAAASARLQDVLGMTMTAESARKFKGMMAVVSLLIMGLAGFTTWSFMRGQGSAVPRRTRAKPEV